MKQNRKIGEKNKSKQKKLKKLWEEIKKVSIELEGWKSLEASLYAKIFFNKPNKKGD